MSKRLATGGSQGEPVRSGSMPFFHANVKAIELTTKNVYGLRILPAFQRDESRLPVSPTSYIAYRDAANVSPETGKAAFTDWYYSFKGYKFIGNDGRGFLSPLMMSKTDQRGIDPLFDCYHLARNSKETCPEWYALTEKGKDEMNAVLEKYRLFAAMNTAMEVDRQVVNRIAVVTKASLDHLKEQLDVLCSRADNPNDPNWADFMLGDVTCPYNGLWATVQKGAFNTAGMEASLFKFSASKDRLVNAARFPIDPNTQWGLEILGNRADISDLEKVTRIPEAGEILEYIVNDGFLPMELIREACQNHWDIPEPKAKRTTISPPPTSGGGGGFAAPQAPRPPGAPAAPTAPTPPVSARQFWAVLPATGAVSQAPMPESVVQSLVRQHNQHIQVMLVGGDNTWHSTQEFGINLPAAPTPPVAPAAPQAPMAPSAPPRPPATPSAPPRPPGAPPAPRTLAPSGPVAGAPAPLAPPGAHAPTPPPQRPAPVQPPMTPPQAAPQPPMAPQAPAAPMAPQAPAAPPAAPQQPAAPQPTAAPAAQAAPQPLNANELAEYQALEAEWVNSCGSGGQMDPAKIQRYSELADRHSAAVAAQG